MPRRSPRRAGGPPRSPAVTWANRAGHDPLRNLSRCGRSHTDLGRSPSPLPSPRSGLTHEAALITLRFLGGANGRHAASSSSMVTRPRRRRSPRGSKWSSAGPAPCPSTVSRYDSVDLADRGQRFFQPGFDALHAARGGSSAWLSMVSFRTATVADFDRRLAWGDAVTGFGGDPAFLERGCRDFSRAIVDSSDRLVHCALSDAAIHEARPAPIPTLPQTRTARGRRPSWCG